MIHDTWDIIHDTWKHHTTYTTYKIIHNIIYICNDMWHPFIPLISRFISLISQLKLVIFPSISIHLSIRNAVSATDDCNDCNRSVNCMMEWWSDAIRESCWDWDSSNFSRWVTRRMWCYVITSCHEDDPCVLLLVWWSGVEWLQSQHAMSTISIAAWLSSPPPLPTLLLLLLHMVHLQLHPPPPAAALPFPSRLFIGFRDGSVTQW